MRKLVVMLGAPGAGKSHWIRENGLEAFTLSPDNIRMMTQAPVMNADGEINTSMANEKLVWKTLYELLEARMVRGDFTVIDATHSKTSMITDYKVLCAKYRYRCIVVDFSDVPLETILAQNKQRPTHKHVPEDYILNVIERLKASKIAPGWTKLVKPDEFDEAVAFTPKDFSHWNKIHHIGDVHGCYDVLQEYLVNGIKEDELYIFTGDYIDRGPQNAEVMKLLMELSEQKNVIFIEGNHERWLWQWANDELGAKASRIFLNETMPQLEAAGIDKKEVRQFYRRLYQGVYYTYGDKTILVSHGGFPAVTDKMEHLATQLFVNGVGKYEDDVDSAWTQNTPENHYQVHGHRNIYRLPIEGSPRSFNLEGQIEMGGMLRVITLDAGGWNKVELKNDNFIQRKMTQAPTIDEGKLTEESLVDYLSNHKYVRRNQLTKDIASFNFTRDAFEDRKWDDLNVKARGLFINTTSNKIVSRSYDKFFNINERSSTKLSTMADTLVFPVYGYTKPNGYLGIVGYDEMTGELIISSKAETRGPFSEWFNELFYKTFDREQVAYIKDKLITLNASLTFEVILKDNDPHIIKYGEDKLVLLDIVKREVIYKKYRHDVVQELANTLGIEAKQLRLDFNTWLEFYEWYKEASKDMSIEEEGYVFEDSRANDAEGIYSNGFMFKMKLPYYVFWKQMRNVKDLVARRRHVNTSSLRTAQHNRVYNFMNSLDPSELRELDIIAIREKMQESPTYSIQ